MGTQNGLPITPLVPLHGSISASGGTQIWFLSVERANSETTPLDL